jgi:hypothetical protein
MVQFGTIRPVFRQATHFKTLMEQCQYQNL